MFGSDILFPVTFTHTFRVLSTDITNENDTLGFITLPTNHGMCPYISDIVSRSTASQFPRWRSVLIGAFILSVDGVPVYTKNEVDAALSAVLVNSSDHQHLLVKITFAIDKDLRKNVMTSMTNSALQSDQICHIAALLAPTHDVPNAHDIQDTGESIDDLPILQDSFVDYLDDLLTQPSLLVKEPSLIQQVVSNPSRLTHCILLCRPDWPDWFAAEHKQLDVHHLHKMFGKPCPRPCKAIVMRAVWNYVVKWNGEKKARMCCDGRVLRLRGMKLLEAIYTSCVSQTGMKIFFTLCALLGYIISQQAQPAVQLDQETIARVVAEALQ
jgi:hypothetical protein